MNKEKIILTDNEKITITENEEEINFSFEYPHDWGEITIYKKDKSLDFLCPSWPNTDGSASLSKEGAKKLYEFMKEYYGE